MREFARDALVALAVVALVMALGSAAWLLGTVLR